MPNQLDAETGLMVEKAGAAASSAVGAAATINIILNLVMSASMN